MWVMPRGMGLIRRDSVHGTIFSLGQPFKVFGKVEETLSMGFSILEKKPYSVILMF